MPGRAKSLVHIWCFEACRKLKFLEHSGVTVDIHYVVHVNVVSSNLIGIDLSHCSREEAAAKRSTFFSKDSLNVTMVKHRKNALNKNNRIAGNPRPKKNRRTTSRPPHACARRRIGSLLPVSRGQLADTAISEVRRFSMISGSSGRPRSHWVNRPSIRPAAMLAV